MLEKPGGNIVPARVQRHGQEFVPVSGNVVESVTAIAIRQGRPRIDGADVGHATHVANEGDGRIGKGAFELQAERHGNARRGTSVFHSHRSRHGTGEGNWLRCDDGSRNCPGLERVLQRQPLMRFIEGFEQDAGAALLLGSAAVVQDVIDVLARLFAYFLLVDFISEAGLRFVGIAIERKLRPMAQVQGDREGEFALFLRRPGADTIQRGARGIEIALVMISVVELAKAAIDQLGRQAGLVQ